MCHAPAVGGVVHLNGSLQSAGRKEWRLPGRGHLLARQGFWKAAGNKLRKQPMKNGGISGGRAGFQGQSYIEPWLAGAPGERHVFQKPWAIWKRAQCWSQTTYPLAPASLVTLGRSFSVWPLAFVCKLRMSLGAWQVPEGTDSQLSMSSKASGRRQPPLCLPRAWVYCSVWVSPLLAGRSAPESEDLTAQTLASGCAWPQGQQLPLTNDWRITDVLLLCNKHAE